MTAGGKRDVVWLLGTGSRAGNWEIRHSMRSFAAHFRDLRQMWIIGTPPDWVDEEQVRVVRFPDSHRTCKDANLIGKLLWLSGEADLSEEFVLCSDDQFLLRDAWWGDFRAYHCGDLAKKVWPRRLGGWHRALRNTARWLKKNGYPAFHLDAHVPYPVAKAAARDMLRTPYAAAPGMTIFSTYHNLAQVWHPGLHKLASIDSGPIRAGIFGEGNDPALTAGKLDRNLFASCDSGTMGDCFFLANMELRFATPGLWEMDGGGESLAAKRAPAVREAAAMTLREVDKIGA